VVLGGGCVSHERRSPEGEVKVPKIGDDQGDKNWKWVLEKTLMSYWTGLAQFIMVYLERLKTSHVSRERKRFCLSQVSLEKSTRFLYRFPMGRVTYAAIP